jgi:predicted dehydrogenase
VRDGRPIRVGIVGFGRAGRVHLDAWRAVAGVEVVAVCDPSPEAVVAARAMGLPIVSDAQELFAARSLDAVSIAVPPAQHAPLAIAALEQGLDVLCEKPLATHGPAAMRMVQTAARTGRHLLLATKFRHVGDLVATRALIAAGTIGEPVGFEVEFTSRVDMRQRWNARRHVSGGGVIIDNGCHAFDIVSFLFGAVGRVHATHYRPVQPLAVEDSAIILVEGSRGLLGRVELSWSLTTQRETYVVVHGTEGSIDVGWRRSRLRLHGRPERPLDAGHYDRHACHTTMMNAFVGVVSGRRRPWISPGECLRMVAAVDAAYRSLRSGRWVSVDTANAWDTRERLRAQA